MGTLSVSGEPHRVKAAPPVRAGYYAPFATNPTPRRSSCTIGSPACGGEKVLEVFCRLWPPSLYTLLHRRGVSQSSRRLR